MPLSPYPPPLTSMSSWMERMPSDEEPAALRRVPRGEPMGNDWPRSPRSHGSTSRYNSVALARDLNGATALDFNAYDFVRTLLEKYDLADIGDGELDANASLAALDGIEALLRRRRDIAARDEAVSREDLRTSLRTALKCREDTERAADNVDTALSRTSLQAGDAAEKLRETVQPLSKLVERRRKLEEARDLVRLLDADEEGLNIVRASEVLKSLREEHRKGSLKSILKREDSTAALVGLERCENELIESLAAGLKKGDEVSSTDGLQLSASVLFDFATAACNLEKEDEFIEAYIDQMPVFAASDTDINKVLEGIDGKIRTDKDAMEIVEKLLKTRWDCSAALREFVPMATEAFPHPLKAWAHLTSRLFEDKISTVAQHILEAVRANQAETTDEKLDVRKLNVEVFSRVLRITACSVHDLIELCVIANEETDTPPLPGGVRREVVRKNFTNVLSELSAFIIGQLVLYVPAERNWAMRKATHAFAEVKDIEITTYMSFEKNERHTYSRFRSLFLRVAKKHRDMTTNATSSALESMHRVASLLVLCVQLSELCDDGQDNDGNLEKDNGGDEGDDNTGAITAPSPLHAVLHVSPFEKAASELLELIEQISSGLLQCYLNNSETLLQGASHLVPTKTGDKFESLWEDGLSPLSACVEAIGAMAGSDKHMEDFLKTLTLDKDNNFDSMPLANSNGAECPLLIAISEKIQLEHHREFNNGIKRLALDAQADTDAAVATVGTHLEEEYFTDYNAYLAAYDGEVSTGEASMAFVRAATVIDRQLGTCKSALAGEELDAVILSLAETVRDAVVAYWVKCKGPFTLRVLLDARAIVNAFPAGAKGTKTIEVLAVLAQMHFDSVDEIWGTLESGTLPNINGDSILAILNKRNDLNKRDRQKIRDVLFIDPDFTEEII